MAFSEKIRLVVDVVTGQASSSLGKLRTDLKNTDGAFGKLKVAGAGVGTMLSQNIGAASLAAGTAIAAFGAKAIGDFQKTALGAGELRDALGVTAEEASQLQEVAGDLGIGVGSVQTAIGRMNKTAGASPEHFDAIGASIARNKDGTMDVIGTFENVAEAIQRIPDAGKRAEAAQKIFGRGWQDVAELIADGADGIRDSMESVEKQKLISDAEIDRAREFRDTMDQLRGVAEGASIVIGGELVESLNDVATIMEAVEGPLKRINDLLGGVPSDGFEQLAKFAVPLLRVPEILDNVAGAVEDMGGEVDLAASAVADLGPALDTVGGTAENKFARGMQAADQSADNATTTYDELERGLFDLSGAHEEAAEAADRQREAIKKAREEAQRGASDAFKLEQAELDLTNQMADLGQQTFETNLIQMDRKRTAEEQARASRDLRLAELDAAGGALEVADAFAESKGAADGSAEKTRLMTAKLRELQDKFPGLREEIQTYIDKLNRIPRNVNTNVHTRFTRSGAAAGHGANNFDVAAASGTTVRAGGQRVLVGEEGPEIVDLPGGSVVHPNGETTRTLTAAGGAGGNTINVYMPPGSDGRDLVRELRRRERYNGPAWRAS